MFQYFSVSCYVCLLHISKEYLNVTKNGKMSTQLQRLYRLEGQQDRYLRVFFTSNKYSSSFTTNQIGMVVKPTLLNRTVSQGSTDRQKECELSMSKIRFFRDSNPESKYDLRFESESESFTSRK